MQFLKNAAKHSNYFWLKNITTHFYSNILFTEAMQRFQSSSGVTMPSGPPPLLLPPTPPLNTFFVCTVIVQCHRCTSLITAHQILSMAMNQLIYKETHTVIVQTLTV